MKYNMPHTKSVMYYITHSTCISNVLFCTIIKLYVQFVRKNNFEISFLRINAYSKKAVNNTKY